MLHIVYGEVSAAVMLKIFGIFYKLVIACAFLKLLVYIIYQKSLYERSGARFDYRNLSVGKFLAHCFCRHTHLVISAAQCFGETYMYYIVSCLENRSEVFFCLISRYHSGLGQIFLCLCRATNIVKLLGSEFRFNSVIGFSFYGVRHREYRDIGSDEALRHIAGCLCGNHNLHNIIRP